MRLRATHVVGWLYEGADRRIPGGVRGLIESEEPFVSPIVELELTYLHEVGRVTEPRSGGAQRIAENDWPADRRCIARRLTRAASDLSWTRDPFDRMIAAQSIVADAPLLTADQTILANLPLATWG